jgi:hypothetical protein
MYDRRESFPAGTPANDPFANEPDRRTGPEHIHERVEDAPPPAGDRPLNPEARAEAFIGKGVKDMDGSRIGTAEGIYYRKDGTDAEWIGISMGLLTKTLHAAPLEGATIDEEEDEIVLAYPKDMVEASPEVEQSGINPLIEAELYAHYNMRRMAQDSDQEPSGLGDPLHPNRP